MKLILSISLLAAAAILASPAQASIIKPTPKKGIRPAVGTVWKDGEGRTIKVFKVRKLLYLFPTGIALKMTWTNPPRCANGDDARTYPGALNPSENPGTGIDKYGSFERGGAWDSQPLGFFFFLPIAVTQPVEELHDFQGTFGRKQVKGSFIVYDPPDSQSDATPPCFARDDFKLTLQKKD